MAHETGLDSHHRATVEKIFRHPTSHNIKWHDVLSLLGERGDGHREPRGPLHRDPRGRDPDLRGRPGPRPRDQAVVDLRRMLRGAGVAPASD